VPRISGEFFTVRHFVNCTLINVMKLHEIDRERRTHASNNNNNNNNLCITYLQVQAIKTY
jgi:hypothetical protein